MQSISYPGARIRRALIATAVVSALASVSAHSFTFSFDDQPVGAAPAGFHFGAARQANPGTWEVAGAGARHHLIHVADPSVVLRGISVAVVDAAATADLTATTRIRLVDGDHAGGLAWRYRDAENFYFVALDLNKHEAGLFRVMDGNRVRLDFKTDVDLDAQEWHTIAITHEGDQIRAQIDGIGVLRTRDSTLQSGQRAGVWSAGNSTTWFDDVAIESR